MGGGFEADLVGACAGGDSLPCRLAEEPAATYCSSGIERQKIPQLVYITLFLARLPKTTPHFFVFTSLPLLPPLSLLYVARLPAVAARRRAACQNCNPGLGVAGRKESNDTATSLPFHATEGNIRPGYSLDCSFRFIADMARTTDLDTERTASPNRYGQALRADDGPGRTSIRHRPASLRSPRVWQRQPRRACARAAYPAHEAREIDDEKAPLRTQQAGRRGPRHRQRMFGRNGRT